jgi:hypothetical protein
MIFDNQQILNYDNRADKKSVGKNVTDLTRSRDILENNKDFKNILIELQKIKDKESPAYKKLDLERQTLIDNWQSAAKSQQLLQGLRGLSVEDRLASFLNFNEEKRQSAEFKYLVKETTKGAVMGATFAAVGSWIFETTGLGHWTSDKLNQLSHFAHTDQAIGWVKSMFSENQGGHAAVEKVATGAAVHSSVLNHNAAPAHLAEVAVSETETPQVEVPPSEMEPVTPETETPQVEVSSPKSTPDNIIPKVHSEQISSEHNSVWRSVKDIFKTNAQELGYKGDVSDTDALNKWSEIQTANAIDHSQGITDKVFAGNQVILENNNGVYSVSVEQGTGFAPGHLDAAVEEVAKPVVPEVKVPVENNLVTENIIKAAPEVKAPVVEAPKPITSEIANKWHLPIDKTNMVDATHVSYATEKGNVIIDTAKGAINKVIGINKEEIPGEFINELKGRVPLDRFINRGGLDKIFSNWSKLTINDKTVYEALHSFNQNKLSPFDLINKISGTFKVVATDVNIDLDNNNFVLGNRKFEMNLKGVDKLVKILSRRFGA